jgi:hypothetical protein
MLTRIALLVINSILSFEIVIKSIGYGLLMDDGVYINYMWKITDIFYLVTYFLDLAGFDN